jgi:hypothetical protein
VGTAAVQVQLDQVSVPQVHDRVHRQVRRVSRHMAILALCLAEDQSSSTSRQPVLNGRAAPLLGWPARVATTWFIALGGGQVLARHADQSCQTVLAGGMHSKGGGMPLKDRPMGTSGSPSPPAPPGTPCHIHGGPEGVVLGWMQADDGTWHALVSARWPADRVSRRN